MTKEEKRLLDFFAGCSLPDAMRQVRKENHGAIDQPRAAKLSYSMAAAMLAERKRRMEGQK